MIVDGLLLDVVAEVGSQAGRHGPRPHGPPLPLQEEGLPLPAAPEDPEGVGVNGAELLAHAEVAGRPVGRVHLPEPPPHGAGLLRHAGQEAVYGGGVG